jgi:hypothetical protein
MSSAIINPQKKQRLMPAMSVEESARVQASLLVGGRARCIVRSAKFTVSTGGKTTMYQVGIDAFPFEMGVFPASSVYKEDNKIVATFSTVLSPEVREGEPTSRGGIVRCKNVM